MKLATKTFDSITRLKLKSGTTIEIHKIKQDNGNDQVVIEKGTDRLVLEQHEISDFITLFKDFLESV
ncbi:MAG: hypothetical protein JSV04_13765 [Candidatus Heimdallarchaeota archaeon]|nr:MAG: hypothetical protein JSV04_13765 [Candidatus Heimdallarchaeota archaeon]